MRITSSIEYATRLMTTLAREYGRAPLPAERLAEADNVPSDYVSQILVRLRRAGLVVSHRGSAGGYGLSRPPAEVTLGQVVRAVDGAVFEDVCGRYDGGAKDCRHQDGCAISTVWGRLGGLVTDYLDGVTLASLLNETPADCGAAPAWLEKLAPATGKESR
jgi:Rrf2 family protein